MAQIKLNVELNSEKATKGIEVLKENIKSLTKDLENVTPNKDLTQQIKALAEYYKTVVKAGQQAVNVTKKEALAAAKLEKEKKQLAILEQKEITAKRNAAKAANQLAISEEKLKKQVSDTNVALAKNEEKLRKLEEQSQKTKKSIWEMAKSAGSSILDMAKKFLKWQSAATLVMTAWNAAKNLILSIVNIQIEAEKKAIELERVLSDSVSRKAMLNDLNEIAYRLGRTFEEATEIAINFARAGYSYSEVLRLTKSGLLAMNVAELDATEASEGLISVLTQFNITAAESTSVIDKLNEVSNNYPVSAEKLIKALQRTGSAAANANLSIDQTIGVITALSKATGRSGENLGTAVNSLIQYSGKNSALDTFANLSSESANVVSKYRMGTASILDVWRQVSREINTLSTGQADMLDAYFNTADGSDLKQQLSKELSGVYDELGGVYDTANTFRKNYFIALLKNIDTADEAAQTAIESANSALKENLKYMDSFEAKMNQMKTSWNDMVSNDSNVLNFLKSAITLVTSLINAIDGLGSMLSMVLPEGARSIDREKNRLAMIDYFNGSVSAGKFAGDIITDLSSPIAFLTDLPNIFQYGSEIMKMFSTGKMSDEVKEIADAIVGIAVGTDKWVNSLEKANIEYDDFVSKLKEYRDSLKETNDLEEKKLSVMEAQKALEDARSQTNVRVFNAKTGLFEYQANIKDVQSAEEKLLQAQTAMEESAYSEIERQVKNGNITNASILALLADVAPYLAPDSTFSSTVKSFLQKEYSINIDEPERLIPATGGVKGASSGIAGVIEGGAAIINGLISVFQDNLSSAINNMTPGSSGIVNNRNQSTTTNNNYTVNGIPISEQSSGSKTMREIFREMELVP